jgi:glucosamine-6-phosphate deaminase
MDEYIGLAPDSPQSFGNFLRDRIFSKVPFKAVNYLNAKADSADECKRYSILLKKAPIDVLLCGIGENGHLAFNDPQSACFDDPEIVKIVSLDLVCRKQQVHDGCFETLKLVPKQAYSLTIPMLMSTAYAVCTVPASTKARAVRQMIHGPITPQCPASVLRLHRNCSIYLDEESGKTLLKDKDT